MNGSKYIVSLILACFHSGMEFLGYPLIIERRAFQRSLNLRVNVNGKIKVTSGKTVTDRKIFKFLDENRLWIEKSQIEYKSLREKYPKKTFSEGETFRYLGHPLPLVLRSSKSKNLKFEIQTDKLICHLPRHLQPIESQYLQALRKCYQSAGRKWLAHRTQFWATKMQLHPRKLSFRSQKTRWGSCSSKGDISLNWRLVAAPLPVLDYVVIHELAHLKFQDHSKNFWQLVQVYDPKFKYNRRWLKEHQWEFDFLAAKSELYL